MTVEILKPCVATGYGPLQAGAVLDIRDDIARELIFMRRARAAEKLSDVIVEPEPEEAPKKRRGRK